MAGDDQRHALGLQLAHQLRQAGAGLGVEAAGWLVQQQHGGLVNDGLPNGQALALAARQLAGQALQQGQQVQLLRHLGHPRLCHVGGQAHGAGGIFQALGHCQPFVQAKKIGQIAHMPMHFAGGLQHIDTMHHDLARRRVLQPGQAAQQG